MKNLFLILCLSGANIYLSAISGFLSIRFNQKKNIGIVHISVSAFVILLSVFLINEYALFSLSFISTINISNVLQNIFLLIIYCLIEILCLDFIVRKKKFKLTYHYLNNNKVANIINAILEELIYRFILYNLLSMLIGRFFAIFMASLLFSLNHIRIISNNRLKNVFLSMRFLIGVVLNIIYLNSNIILSILFHISYNLIVIYIYPWITILLKRKEDF